MSKGSKRKVSDVVIVKTGLKGSGASGGTGGADSSCPTSFRVEVDPKFKSLVNMSVTTKVLEKQVLVMCRREEVARITSKRGERIAGCIEDSHYKYAGTIIRDKDKLYAELQVA